MSRPNLLFVLTSHEPGWYLPELAHPYEVLIPFCNITVASPLGGETPLHDLSVSGSKDDPVCMSFFENRKEVWKTTKTLADFRGKAGEFDAVFYVGGYGPMFDVVDSPVSAAVVTDFYAQRKLLAGICHGPAAFAHVKAPGTDHSVLYGHNVTGVSQAEVDHLFPITKIEEPWSVEGELKKATGGPYEKAAEAFGGKVVRSEGKDGRVFITGQNPASGNEVGRAVYKELFGKELE